MLRLVMVPDYCVRPLPASFQLVPSKLDCQYKLPTIVQSQANLSDFLLTLGQLAVRAEVFRTLWFLAPGALGKCKVSNGYTKQLIYCLFVFPIHTGLI